MGDISELSLDFKSEEESVFDNLDIIRAGNSCSDDGKEVNTQDISFQIRPPSPNMASQKSYSSQPSLQLPYAEKHECALLFVDISGFTKLSTLLDPERLSKVINSYFQMIVNEVTYHGGDVLKFAGDGLFAEWQLAFDHAVGNNDSVDQPHSIQRKSTLAECIAAAASCGARIVDKCSDFPVYENGQSGGQDQGAGEQVAALNVHCGLGAGEIVGVHVGDNSNRREYLILGDPIDQVVEAANAASLGELLVSEKVLGIMITSKLLNDCGGINVSPALIARKNLSSVKPGFQIQQSRCAVNHLWEEWDIDRLKEYLKLICLYAHPVVVDNEINASGIATSTAQQRHSEEAEIRTVYVLFISMPRIRLKFTDNIETDEELFKMLNSIMNTTTRELDRFHGHLRQFIVDDKGLVLIATFGLRGSTSPNMVTERGLPATNAIHNALQNELGVFNRVGATVGNAYCGVVGGVERHEYAVMGPTVNLAARLMYSPINPGILVDEAVRLKAGKAYSFKSLAPVTAKGYSESVPIFEPLSSLERRWGRMKSDFVGRKDEITQILEIVRDMTCQVLPAKIIFVSAESGTGKSTLAIHAIDQMRRIMTRSRKKFMIAKHICRESDLLVPFSMFRSVIVDLITELEITGDDKSLCTYQSRASRSWGSGSVGFVSGAVGGSCNLEWDLKSQQSNISKASRGSLSCSSGQIHRILAVCNEVNAPSEVVELICHHLLGLDMDTLQGMQAKTKNAPNLQGTINFMLKIFQRCTRTSIFTVIALDDVHQMDAMSWRVVQKLFGSMRNLLIICTARPLSRYKLTVDQSFWEQLNGEFSDVGRFFFIDLKRLEVDDIKQMIAKNLGIYDVGICEDFQKDVFTQSRGMPHFASEILSCARRRNSIGMVGDTFGWIAKEKGEGTLSHTSVGDIIVARLDSFDAPVRNALNLGAVIGFNFEFADIIAITQHFAGASRHEKCIQAKKTHDALDFLVTDGILIETCIGGDAEAASSLDHLSSVVVCSRNDDPIVTVLLKDTNPYEFKNKSYQFCHDIWRSSILSLMLDTRKKHIHRTIAQILEQHQTVDESDDFSSRLKLFGHWRSAGETCKAASVALAIGSSFESLGLFEQSIKLYNDTLSIWRGTEAESNTGISGLSEYAIKSLTVSELEFLIKVYVTLGKCLAHVHRGGDSVVAYQDALRILQECPCADLITDRSIVFPIFSGLFLALKFGQIEQDVECSYEQNLVDRFVNETKLHGDIIHYTRALSMQAELYGRLRNYEKAFEVFEELQATYDVDKHTVLICEAYRSDLSAQCFGVSCLWLVLLDRKDEALARCEYIFKELMPKMDIRNVHNSCTMLYPTIWVMKDANRSLEMLETFIKYVVTPFDEYYGEGAFTFYLPAYDPVMMLLELDGRKGKGIDILDNIVDWAIHDDNLRFGTVINNSLGGYGRTCNSMSAEICLLLGQRVDVCDDTKATLVFNGYHVGKEILKISENKRMWHSCAMDIRVLDELEHLAYTLNINL